MLAALEAVHSVDIERCLSRKPAQAKVTESGELGAYSRTRNRLTGTRACRRAGLRTGLPRLGLTSLRVSSWSVDCRWLRGKLEARSQGRRSCDFFCILMRFAV